MSTRIGLAVLLAHVHLASYADDGSKNQPAAAAEVRTDATLGERIAALRLEFEAREKALSGELAAAREAGERGSEARAKKLAEVVESYQRDERAIFDKVVELVRAHPADPAAFEGVLLLRASFGDDVLEIVRAHFLDDPRMGRLCAFLSERMSNSSKELLGEVAAKNHDRRIQGQATYAIGLYACNLYDRRIKGRKLTESTRESTLEEARRSFDKVVKDYPDVTSADGTFRLADKASAELVRIANIPTLKIGKIAPNVAGEDLDGKPLKLSDYRGKVVVLCFWATWCAPCMAMVPHERELVKRMEGKPFALVGVDCDQTEDRDKARKTARDEKMSWPSFWDGGINGPIQTRYNVDSYPTLYVLDAQGVIRFIDVRGKDLDRAVDALLVDLKSGTGVAVRK
ncbi:MAG: TlpA disulfide reductase family protein [Paludisphaera borealis]|uniref:TlpA family protein disulfide reductase n=1 Tax=Paludisphaera borealis TaxID=1387353 RepID=UPI00284B1582|nr:TlpA disulfide reductase family protein [Paludisphaera borealis]MDR3619276.1 TlpA disulfide reductase family protein [Paludisphaera borealis]